jgi:hypothetical protein
MEGKMKSPPKRWRYAVEEDLNNENKKQSGNDHRP